MKITYRETMPNLMYDVLVDGECIGHIAAQVASCNRPTGMWRHSLMAPRAHAVRSAQAATDGLVRAYRRTWAGRAVPCRLADPAFPASATPGGAGRHQWPHGLTPAANGGITLELETRP
jgi:hypothetical protein